MSIRQCACLKPCSAPPIPRLSTFRIFLKLLLAFLMTWLSPVPSSSAATETIVVTITLNSEGKGEFFVNLTDDKDFLVRTADMRAMGVKEPAGKIIEIAGEPYLSLKSMQGAEFVFHEKTLTLEITVSPSLLSKGTIDFLSQRPPNVYYPRDTSAFLNYGFNYTAGNSFDFQSFSATSQIGIRTGDFLFLSDSVYTKDPTENKFVRLMSAITYDRRKELDRFVLGDFFSSSGDLGSSVNLGGLSYSKVYQMDPYFIKQPMLAFSGVTTLPSEAEIYLNGMRIRTEKLSPGQFELRNINYYGGAGNVEVLIKDAFGRMQRIAYPFYFTDVLLKKGLHEYSYNLGFLRENFGMESNKYGSLAFSGFHRYGISDSLTVGLRAEAKKYLYNFGPQASWLIGEAGVVTLSLSDSVGKEERTGFAGSLDYTYQSRTINANAFFRRFTKDYATIVSSPSDEKTKYEAGAGIGYGVPVLGTLSLDFATTKKYVGQNRQSVSATYTRNISNKSTFFLSCRNIRENGTANEFFVGITYSPWQDTSVSARYEKSKDVKRETIDIQKNPPIGEGFSYRASLERNESLGVTSYTVDPYFQYNARYGIYSAEYRGQFNTTGKPNTTFQLSASGAIAYVGNTIGLTRPVTDSFGLVKVGELEGVRVYQSNQEIGRTNSSGKVFVPDLNSYYDNYVSINDKDLPINYSIPDVVRYVSPPLRSGSVIPFEATKIQAIIGTLKIRVEGEVRPVEFYEVKITVDSKEIIFPTGSGGEFYMENIQPGTYGTTFVYKEKTCSFTIEIPKSDEMIVDLGDVYCDFGRGH